MKEPDRSLIAALKAWIPFRVGGSYRYFTGSLAYVLHRITGLGLVFFLFFHILSITKATSTDPWTYDVMIRRMQEPDFKLGEVLLWGALLFHGLNGIRILLVDFVLTRSAVHKRLFWGFSILIVILLLVGAIPMVLHWNVAPLFAERLPTGEI